MVSQERNKTYQPPTRLRTSREMAQVADRARDLEARMTVPQREALRAAGDLYRKHSDTDGAGKEFVIESKVLKLAGTLIQFANGDEGAVDARADANKLLASKR